MKSKLQSKIVTVNGQKYFQMGARLLEPFAFKSFRPTWKNVQQFYKAGVRIFHVYCSGLPSGLKVPYSLFGETWFGERHYDFTNLDRQIDFFRENAPDALVFVNVHLDSRAWWLEQNPGNPNSFTHLSQIACNEKWRQDTADYLKALIRHTEEKYNDFVLGYFLLGGTTTEWFSDYDHEASHPNKLAAYRAFLQDDTALIPEKDLLERPEDEIFLNTLSPEEQDRVVTYRKFHNNLIADTVLFFAAEAQKELQHQKIVGLFFGYILELLHQRMWEAGHIEFDKINRSPDIDLLATPSSYQFRAYEDVGAYMLLCDTLELNQKLCFISFDHTTFLVPTLAENPARVCGDPETDVALKLLAKMRSGNPKDLLKTKFQTIEAMRREFMQKIIKRVGLWWFDMLEGWFYDEDLMQEVSHQLQIFHRIQDRNMSSVSEVAVLISGESLYKVSKNSSINTELICNQRNGLARMGAPYDMYSLNDIGRIDPDRYRLYIFIGAFELTEEQLRTIDRLKKDGHTLLFIGAPALTSHGLKTSCDLTEMPLLPLETREQTVITAVSSYGYALPHKDNVYVYAEADVSAEAVASGAADASTTADFEVLGTYKVSHRPALCRQTRADYTVFFSGIGNLDFATLAAILEQAGVHRYADTGEGVFICHDFVGVYSPCTPATVLSLKEDGTYLELFTDRVYRSENRRITLDTRSHPAQMLQKME